MTVTLEHAQSHLPELIDQLGVGEELTIVKDDKPIAGLIAKPQVKQPAKSAFGCCKDMVISYVEDDEHLKDFEEYMS